MPKFVIERQYLVPMYQHIVVEAENLEEACKKAITDDIDWDTQKMDSDGSRATTLTSAKAIPPGRAHRQQRPERPPAGHGQLRHVPLRERGADRPAARDPRQVY